MIAGLERGFIEREVDITSFKRTECLIHPLGWGNTIFMTSVKCMQWESF